MTAATVAAADRARIHDVLVRTGLADPRDVELPATCAKLRATVLEDAVHDPSQLAKVLDEEGLGDGPDDSYTLQVAERIAATVLGPAAALGGTR